MCGFLAIINPKADYSKATLQSIANKFIHRGPDHTGIVICNQAVFVHNRLAIIDTTAASNQPMTSSDGRYVLVYNGEIYNFEALYTEHLAEDPRVRADSDTSVLLYLLINKGESIIAHLDGMFAFVFYDTINGSTIAARDTFGEKPLYFNRSDDQVIFGSDLATVRHCISYDKRNINRSALYSLLTKGFIEGPGTIWEDISAVEPGRVIFYDENKWTESHFPSRAGERRPEIFGSDDEILDKVRSTIQESVKSRMRSDVPVGLFLSGGIDSAAILGACKGLGLKNITPISLDFDEEGFGEYKLAKTTGQFCGFEVKRVVISRKTFFDNLDSFYRVMPQPTMDGFNTFFISKLASDLGIKVWISGVGGDEVFAGYTSSEKLFPRSQMLRLLGRFKPLCKAGLALTRDLSRLNRLLDSALEENHLIGSYRTLRGPYTQSLASRLINEAPSKQENYHIPYPHTEFQVVQKIETDQFLRWQLLPDIDAFSMASSIEVRAPLLNITLFDLVRHNSPHYSSPWRRKAILKRAMQDDIAPEVLNSPKSGFAFPLSHWIREYANEDIKEVIFNSDCSKYWNKKELQFVWSAFEKGRIGWDVVWPIYTINKWLQHHA